VAVVLKVGVKVGVSVGAGEPGRDGVGETDAVRDAVALTAGLGVVEPVPDGWGAVGTTVKFLEQPGVQNHRARRMEKEPFECIGRNFMFPPPYSMPIGSAFRRVRANLILIKAKKITIYSKF
jgi:hypothetical protein